MPSKVVIIGGGYGGLELATKLTDTDFEVTLIDNKAYFENTMAYPRVIAELKDRDAAMGKLIIKHEDYLKRTQFILGTVETLDANHLMLQDGSRIEFDCAVVASGSSYATGIKSNGGTLDERLRFLYNESSNIARTKRIVVVGGGVVGVEMATELKNRYPGKKVTLVHRGDRYLSPFPEKATKCAVSWMQKHGIHAVYNAEVVERQKDKLYLVVDGRETSVKCDYVFWCTGIHPNTEFMKENMSESLDEHGYVMVNEYLQVEGKNNIFAIGDCTNIPCVKTAAMAAEQAEVLLKTIKTIKTGSDMKTYDVFVVVLLILGYEV